MSVQQPVAVNSRKTHRRLKPEIAARLAARRSETKIRELYERPVDELSPDELARMKAAFFRG